MEIVGVNEVTNGCALNLGLFFVNDGEAIENEAVNLLNDNLNGVLAYVEYRIGCLNLLLSYDNCGFLSVGRSVYAVVVKSACSNEHIYGTLALSNLIKVSGGNYLTILDGIASGNEVRVTLNNEVNVKSFKDIRNSISIVRAAVTVVVCLVGHNDGPLSILISLEVCLDPSALSLHNELVVAAVMTGVIYDEVSVAVVIGIEGLIHLLDKHLGPSGIVIRKTVDSVYYRRVKVIVTAVIGMVKVKSEVEVLVRGEELLIVVTDSREVRNGCACLTESLEVVIPLINVGSVLNNVTGMKNKRGVIYLGERLINSCLGVHKALVGGLGAAPGYTLSIAYRDEGEFLFGAGGGGEAVCLAPLVFLVGATLNADLIFILGIRGERGEICLVVVLSGILGGLCHLISVNHRPFGLAESSVLDSHFATCDEVCLSGPSEESC